MDRTIGTARTSGPRELPEGGHVGAAATTMRTSDPSVPTETPRLPPPQLATPTRDSCPHPHLDPTPIPTQKVLRFVSWAVAGIGLAVMNLLIEMVS